jgi:hypothetical protein
MTSTFVLNAAAPRIDPATWCFPNGWLADPYYLLGRLLVTRVPARAVRFFHDGWEVAP